MFFYTHQGFYAVWFSQCVQIKTKQTRFKMVPSCCHVAQDVKKLLVAMGRSAGMFSSMTQFSMTSFINGVRTWMKARTVHAQIK